jgi:hypothetical protein
MVTRLVGGLTPGDGSDPRTFPAIWNTTADVIEGVQSDLGGVQSGLSSVEGSVLSLSGVVDSQGSAITAIEGWGLDDLSDVTIGTAVADGQVLAYSTAVSGWVNAPDQGGLVAVKSALFTGTQVASSVAASGNVAVTDLSITHEVSDPSNKLIISAFVGAAGNSAGFGNVGIAVHDGTNLIAIGDADGSRSRVSAGGYAGSQNVGASALIVAIPSVTFVHTPGSGSKTYTVRVVNVLNSAQTLYINRPENNDNAGYNARAASSLLIQEVVV